MASVCDLCGKKPSFGMNVSFSHRRTKRRWNPNIQRVRALVGGTPHHINVCTGCIRSGKVTKPVRAAQRLVRTGAGSPAGRMVLRDSSSSSSRRRPFRS